MPRYRHVDDLNIQRQLTEAAEIERITKEWREREREIDEANRQLGPVAGMYATAYRKYGPDDQITRGLHECILTVAERASPSLTINGAEATDTPESVRVFCALDRGVESVRTACNLARAAAAIGTGDRDAAREFLRTRPDTADGGTRERIRKARVMERWLDALRFRVGIVDGFVKRGEWPADHVATERARLIDMIARHVDVGEIAPQ